MSAPQNKDENLLFVRNMTTKLQYNLLLCKNLRFQLDEINRMIKCDKLLSSSSCNESKGTLSTSLIRKGKNTRSDGSGGSTYRDPKAFSSIEDVLSNINLDDENTIFCKHLGLKLDKITDKKIRLMLEQYILNALYAILLRKYDESSPSLDEAKGTSMIQKGKNKRKGRRRKLGVGTYPDPEEAHSSRIESNLGPKLEEITNEKTRLTLERDVLNTLYADLIRKCEELSSSSSINESKGNPSTSLNLKGKHVLVNDRSGGSAYPHLEVGSSSSTEEVSSNISADDDIAMFCKHLGSELGEITDEKTRLMLKRDIYNALYSELIRQCDN